MRIDIWSDIVCPWCYIGKRRLESALRTFEHAGDIEIHWRSYQLDPGAPTTPTQSVADHLGQKYGGGPAAGQQMVDKMEAVAAEEGLLFRLGKAQRVGTLDAHRLLHLAAESGTEAQGTLKEALLHAYFIETRNIADPVVLAQIAVQAGLDEARVIQVLSSREYAEAVDADLDQGADLGISGVPFFVVDGRYAVSGAQPAETFSQLLERAWSDSHPTLEMVGAAGSDDACGPDGCAI